MYVLEEILWSKLESQKIMIIDTVQVDNLNSLSPERSQLRFVKTWLIQAFQLCRCDRETLFLENVRGQKFKGVCDETILKSSPENFHTVSYLFGGLETME